jgi:acetyl-CoA carboxylase biotin carboxylase subunit
VTIRRVLIANRGEIAVRVIRTCQRLGIETVLAASDADVESLAARMADHVVRIGPPQSAASYLSVDAIVSAAVACRVDAVHPGYGFLAENPALAAACAGKNIIFIGPSPAQLKAVGDKVQARAHAVAAGLPVAPGGEVDTLVDAERLVESVGLPVLIKAVGGGGGRGMRLVTDHSALAGALQLAMAEAKAAFSDPRVYVERYVTSGRHVEVQVLGDGHQVIHFGDRDCSVQRRYQKLVEEAPAPHLAPGLRRQLHEAAAGLARHLQYRGLGTVEFLVDTQQNAFYFLEVNARIQVEHPVTEAVCGLDLVAEQIAVAEGRPLRIRQDDVEVSGHAVECRINAEEWREDFRPSPGTVTRAVFPIGEGIRVDTHLQAGAAVPPYYDSLLAKVIAVGRDRDAALQRLGEALDRCYIEGVSTTLSLHRALIASRGFAEGGVDTGWLPRWLATQAAGSSTEAESRLG